MVRKFSVAAAQCALAMGTPYSWMASPNFLVSRMPPEVVRPGWGYRRRR